MYTYGEIISGFTEKMLWISLVIGLVLLARIVLRKAPKIYSYILWFTVLFRILCPLGIGGIFSVLPENVNEIAVNVSDNFAKQPLRWIERIGTENHEQQITEEVNDDEVRSGPIQQSNSGENPEEKVDKLTMVLDICFVIYMVVYLVLVLYALINIFVVRFKLRDAILVEANIYRTDRVDNSLVCGLFRPRIYVNPNLLDEDLMYVLAHEKCHIRRRDYLIKPIAFMICSIAWINPLVWVAYIYMMRDMEMSCDERAMRDMTGEDKKKYSYLLLQMVTKNEHKFWQTPSLGGNAMEKRIKNIVQNKKPAIVTVIVAFFSLFVCGCGAFSSPIGLFSDNEQVPYKEEITAFTFNENMFHFPDSQFGFHINNGLQDPTSDKVYFIANRQNGKKGKMVEDDLQIISFDGVNTNTCFSSTNLLQEANKLGAYFANGYYVMGADGKIYISLVKYDKQFPSDGEVDYSKLTQEDWYLFQLDLKTQEYRKVDTPKWTPISNQSGYRSVTVFKDGNLLVTDQREEGQKIGIYSATDGSLIREIKNENTISNMYAGDDFYYCFSHERSNINGDEVKVSIYNEKTGVLMNEIKVGNYFDPRDMNVTCRYYKGTFYLCNSKAIYSANKEDVKFSCLINPELSNSYCLGDAKYRPGNIFVFPEDNKYYVMYTENPKLENPNILMCRYTKKMEE